MQQNTEKYAHKRTLEQMKLKAAACGSVA